MACSVLATECFLGLIAWEHHSGFLKYIHLKELALAHTSGLSIQKRSGIRRYNLPESAYYSYYRGLAAFRDKTKDKGISTQQAAKHIADGLSKPRPPRFLYTGSEYRIVLLYAFIQNWISNSFIANMVKNMFGLSKPYVPYAATNGNAAKVQKED